MDHTEISVRGVMVRVPSVEIDGRTVIVTGNWLRLAVIKDEEFQPGETLTSPGVFIEAVRRSSGADLFTFRQKLTDPVPRFPFTYEWESVAAICTTSFSNWWEKCVSSDLRKDVRRAAKRGVVVRAVSFTDDFVEGIKAVYDETPIRHGRPFWHYGKEFEAVKRENSTYLQRSEFLGAYLGEELIGFLKIVYVDQVAQLMQIVSKDSHRDKRPANALIAKAVEVCEARGCSHLTYGKFRYSRETDSLSAFKARNGFVEILVPKYYVPFTTKGNLALKLGIHAGLVKLIPDPLATMLKRVRASAYRQLPLIHRTGSH